MGAAVVVSGDGTFSKTVVGILGLLHVSQRWWRLADVFHDEGSRAVGR